MNNRFFPETEDAHLGWNDIPSNFPSQVVCVKALTFIPTTAPQSTTSTPGVSTTTPPPGTTATTKASTTTQAPQSTTEASTTRSSSATTSTTRATTTHTTTKPTAGTSTTTEQTTKSVGSNSSIRNIREMAIAVLNNPFQWDNYGCAGRGSYEPFAKTAGLRRDVFDRAFFMWKSCYHCATDGDESKVIDYDYNKLEDSCGKLLISLNNSNACF